MFLAFEKCLNMREDAIADKAFRLSILEEAKGELLRFGQPYVEADELMAMREWTQYTLRLRMCLHR